MLDTFVVAALIGSVQLSRVITAATASAEPAVYFFATAILLSILLSFIIGGLAARSWGASHALARLDVTLVIAPWLAAACLVAALFEPLLLIEKKVFENVYALPQSIGKLFEGGELYLGGLVAVLVVALPLGYFLGLGLLALLQCSGRSIDKGLSRLVVLERLAMVDVYFLGLLLVYTRVSNIATVTRPAGFWLVAGAAGLSIYCAFRVRRVW
jgi:uncharacterized paraquat-inducible protein A